MRETKVRIWDVGQMFYECSIGSHNPAVCVDNEWKECTEKAIVMLGTNLKDKNGKEIYGGDIIRHENDDISVGTIVYKECYFEIQFQSGNCNFITTEKIESFGIEVIGNIYENPNLLSQDK